jgi:hypothetical protein
VEGGVKKSVLFERSEFHRFQPTGALSLTGRSGRSLDFLVLFYQEKSTKGNKISVINSVPRYAQKDVYQHILLQVIRPDKTVPHNDILYIKIVATTWGNFFLCKPPYTPKVVKGKKMILIFLLIIIIINC